MTVLFLTTVLPAGQTTGGEFASQAFIEAMRLAGHRVVVLGYSRAGSDLELGEDELSAGTRPIETRNAGLRPLAWIAAAFALRIPYSMAKYRSRRYRRVMRETLERLKPGLVVVEHAQMAWVVPRTGVRAPIVYLAQNVEHHLYREAAVTSRQPIRWLNHREAQRMIEVERRLVGHATCVWTLSSADAEALSQLAPCSPPLTFALTPPMVSSPQEVAKMQDVGILGTWTWAANAAGLKWFCERVYPLLSDAVSIAVAGAGAEKIAEDRPNVTRWGRVPDSIRFLGSARVIAVPSVAGSGVQVKTLEAIATGQPVVATPVALRGIPDPPPTVRVADQPAEFAASLLAMLDSPPGPIASRAAQEWAAQRRAGFRTAVATAVAELDAASDPQRAAHATHPPGGPPCSDSAEP